MSETLISIHCARPGFRRYGILFATPTTLVEVTDNGRPSKDSSARHAITPAQHNDLRAWCRTPNAPLSVSDPDEATQRVSQLESERDELQKQMATLQRDNAAAAEAIEQAKDERAAIEKERAVLEQKAEEMRKEIEQREQVARQLEQRIDDDRQTLSEIAEETEAATRPQGAPSAKSVSDKAGRGKARR